MLLKLAACLAICVPMILSEASPEAAAASVVKPIAKGSYGHQERDYDRGNEHYRGRDEGYEHHRGRDEGYEHHRGRDEGYGNHHEHYGHHGHFSYDTHYCSVHASFALVLPRDKDYTPAENNNNNYGNNNNNYGKNNNYGRESHHHRFFARQFCRYAATQNHEACKFCCRVAARSANTSPDDIVAAIFAFDPANPTGNGAGYQGDDEGYGHGGGPYRKKRNAVGIPIKQCVCCAPKRDY